MGLGLHCGRLDFHGRGRWHQHLYERKMVSALVYADSWASRMTEIQEDLPLEILSALRFSHDGRGRGHRDEEIGEIV